MPWETVTVREQKQRFIKDYLAGYYRISELAERYSITRKTAHKWINRFAELGTRGLADRPRRPTGCPWSTDQAISTLLIELKRRHPSWGARTLRDIAQRRHPQLELPSESTVHRILARAGLVKKRRRYRRLHPGCPKHRATEPNEIWAIDYKGQFKLRNGQYCYALTVSDLDSRMLLGCDAQPRISLESTMAYLTLLFRTYGLPKRIRSDNGSPFASNALARLSQLSVWFIRLGIYPELIEPGHPEQNGIHERMHRTLKAEATIPPEYSLDKQQQRFDAFRHEFNTVRPHQAIGMHTPAERYHRSPRPFPEQIEPYRYPAHFTVCYVSKPGTIRMLGKQCFLSGTLVGDFVGLEEVDEGIYDVFFRFYHIGRYDSHKNRVGDVISRVSLIRSRPGRRSKV